jgi:hypothetical protein
MPEEATPSLYDRLGGVYNIASSLMISSTG